MNKYKSKFRDSKYIPGDKYELQAAKKEIEVEELYRKKNKDSKQIDEMVEEFLEIGNLYRQSWESNKLRKIGNKKKARQNYSQALKFASDKQKQTIEKELKKINERNEKFSFLKGKGLENRFVFAIFSMGSLLFALFFTSLSLTGYSISGLTEESFRFGGVVLFVLGLVFAFSYIKNKK